VGQSRESVRRDSRLKLLRIIACACLSLPGAWMPAIGAAYPVKPIRLVVGFVAGGPVDITARAIGSRLTGVLGQPIVIDNRSGASGVIATELVAKSSPDGHTLLMCSASNAITAALSAGAARNFLRDITPVSKVAIITSILVVNPSLPAESVKDLIALAKARPGQLRYASTGIGSSSHLAGEMFKIASEIDIVHIPYKGGAPAAIDLLSGQVQLSFISAPATMTYIKSGRVRALAVTNAKRSVLLPDLPTISEAGVAGYEFEGWHGMCAPAATPRAIIAQLYRELATITGKRELIEFLAQGGAEAVAVAPDAFASELRAEITKWAAVARSTGIKLE